MAVDFKHLADEVRGAGNLAGLIALYEQPGHAVYLFGIPSESAFRCNSYLVHSGSDAILVDPGSYQDFDKIKQQVAQVLPPEAVTGLILSHQDPDVSASIVSWVKLNPAIKIFSTPRSHVLLPHYGYGNYGDVPVDVEQQSPYPLSSGVDLHFIAAPFLHFPGAVITLDSASGYLFSGDVWAALDTEWKLVVDSFDEHRQKLDLFHKDYMASNVASRGFAQSLSKYDIKAILPQHGSIIGPDHVQCR